MPIFLFLKRSLSFKRAAKATAEEGSTTIFKRSQINFMALIMSTSETQIMAVTYF